MRFCRGMGVDLFAVDEHLNYSAHNGKGTTENSGKMYLHSIRGNFKGTNSSLSIANKTKVP